jgi:excisionase family DNA binding protein
MDVRGHQKKAEGAQSPWLTAKEAAARARCSEKRIYRSVAAKHLKAVRLGSRLLFRTSARRSIE